MYFEISYEFPRGSGKRSKNLKEFNTFAEARAWAPPTNPTVEIKQVEGPKRPGTHRAPKRTNYAASDNAAFFEFLAENAAIRVQLPMKSVATFSRHYHEATGECVNEFGPYFSIIKEGSKWGIAVTITFPVSGLPLVPRGIKTHITSFATPDFAGITDRDFCWELFSLGFRLGTKHEYKTIKGATA